MSDLCKPKRAPDFIVNYKGDPCWEFFIEERLQYNKINNITYRIRALSDNTLEFFDIGGDSWFKYGDSTVDKTYIRYIEEVVNKILLEQE